jgi:hypothetical protein
LAQSQEAILFDTINNCGQLDVHVNVRVHLLDQQIDCDGTMEELVENSLRRLQSELPKADEFSMDFPARCPVHPKLRLAFSIFGQIPFSDSPIPLLTISHTPETRRGNGIEYGMWMRHLTYIFHQPDTSAIAKEAENASWEDADDQAFEDVVSDLEETSDDSDESAALSDNEACFPQYNVPPSTDVQSRLRLNLSQYIHTDVDWHTLLKAIPTSHASDTAAADNVATVASIPNAPGLDTGLLQHALPREALFHDGSFQ